MKMLNEAHNVKETEKIDPGFVLLSCTFSVSNIRPQSIIQITKCIAERNVICGTTK